MDSIGLVGLDKDEVYEPFKSQMYMSGFHTWSIGWMPQVIVKSDLQCFMPQLDILLIPVP